MKLININLFYIVLIISLIFQSWTMADDIKDYEIEEMTVEKVY